MTTTERLASVAREYLSEADAAAWTALLRPGARLVRGDGDGGRDGDRGRDGGPVAARLGGVPRLPADAGWPRWEGHGPLGFVASVDCAAAAEAGALDIAWPKDGTLLFFLYGEAELIDIDKPETQAGARVVYVPADAEAVECEVPEQIEVLPEVPLSAVAIATEPGEYHRAVRDAFPVEADETRRFAKRPVNERRFVRALEAALDVPDVRHQLGGWAIAMQGDVEDEAAVTALGGGSAPPDQIGGEARRWVLLAQFDTDEEAGLEWGETATAYWMIRREDLAAGRFDRALFTMQCC
ncbi:YwqG family protein [Catenulispora pinisilvae]|uniref:YwqG family protein n=1 Tax=Catenulispora pinisilvae TaxID=2705253 RepID=UPI0018923DA7|nr:YwqG family protein [Catenulispora pinisilvae]